MIIVGIIISLIGLCWTIYGVWSSNRLKKLILNEKRMIAEKVIDDRMELDYFSSLYGTVIFRQDREQISENEIQQIQSALLANGIYSQTQKTTKEYLLR